MAAWNAVSKQATAGSPGRALRDRVERGERLRLVQRGERVEARSSSSARDLVVDHAGSRTARRRARSGARPRRPSPSSSSAAPTSSRSAVAEGARVDAWPSAVVRGEQPQLEAARPGVDDEDPHRRQLPGGHRARSSRGPRAGRPRARACTRAAQALVDHLLAQAGRALAEPGHAVDHVHDQVEAVQVVEHDHVERRRGRALLLVAAHVEVAVVGAPVGEPVDQPRVAVVGEDHRPVGR